MLQVDIQNIENYIGILFQKWLISSLSKEESFVLETLADSKMSILLKEEKLWRLKSRPLWLQQRDNNAKFFHKYANYRKNVNSIWEIDIKDGIKDRTN